MHPYRRVVLANQMQSLEGLLANLRRELRAGCDASEMLPEIIGGCIDNARAMVAQARRELDEYAKRSVAP